MSIVDQTRRSMGATIHCEVVLFIEKQAREHPWTRARFKDETLKEWREYAAARFGWTVAELRHIEALAAGAPVVQPRHGGFPEIVQETGGGLITEPNAKALADGIETLLLDPARARALGAAEDHQDRGSPGARHRQDR